MVADVYPVPRLCSNIQKCDGKGWYVTLDMNSGFWNVPIEEGSKHLTAFLTSKGLYEFNVILFGIKNSPAEFQRAVDFPFAAILDTCVAYIDDLIICGNEKN